jgi:predicted AAA+ superfamily ATPase
MKMLELPFEANEDKNIFKIYFNDIGLLCSTFKTPIDSQILNDNLGVYKGAVYENFVADILIKKNLNLNYFAKTYYDVADNKNQKSFEIDFVLFLFEKISLLEIKSGNRGANSLSYLKNKYKNKINAFKFSQKILSDYNDIKCFPLYLLPFLF